MATPSSELTLAGIGCGSRTRTYFKIATSLENRYRVVAAADPIKERVNAVQKISNNPDFQGFCSSDELLAQPKLADVLVIGTQDNYHFEPAKKALEKGYHLLLEKPAAQTLEEVQELARLAKKHDRKILLCFVLRYTDFYSKVHEFIQSGRLGEVISIRAIEGVDPWHQAHSFVRGHWAQKDESTPMIIAKSSHDTDLISWLMNSRCRSVSSFGRLSFFRSEKAPDGALARCTDGCPHKGTCTYDSHRYLTDQKRWLAMVYPDPENYTDEEVLEWLKTSPWGRCAWHCDNDVVDHQIVNMDFENGNTASLTMTAFEIGRGIEIYGTKASLRGGNALKESSGYDFTIREHATNELENITLPEVPDDGYQGHGGGDLHLIDAMDAIFRGEGDQAFLIDYSIEGHIIGFAAEKSRLEDGKPILLETLRD